MTTATTIAQRKRVRTGCLNCRRKHKKCDEQKPTCDACVAKGEPCEWPVPRLKRSSRRSSSSSTSTTSTVVPACGLMPTPYTALPPHGPLVDHRSSLDLSTYSLQPDIHTTTSSDTTWTSSSYSPRNFQMNSTQLPMRLPLEPLMKPQRFTQQEFVRLEELKTLMASFLNRNETNIIQPELNLSIDEECKLMTDFLTRTAPSMDVISDSFTQEIPHLSISSNSVKFSIYTLASIHVAPHQTLKLFQMALNYWIQNKRADMLIHDTSLLMLSLFLFHHNAHHKLYPFFQSTNKALQVHFTILRLTIQPNIIIMDDPLLSLLSFHQNDFNSTFLKCQTMLNNTNNDIILIAKGSPFPQELLSSHKAIYTQLILNMGMVFLLLNKPMDLRIRSHPISHFAKLCCGIIQTNLSRAPWFMNWCLYTVGKFLTHETEHDCLLQIMQDDHWRSKLKDYWEGRGDV